MNIYIYGNQGFKKDIHSTLDHANIKFKLDSNCTINDIDSLSELKEIIRKNPHDIYLIDDEKIIKKNSKIKFLNPKDGIEEEFLLDNGIADLSVNSLKEIPRYILKKYEELKGVDSDIQNSIMDIVDEAYGKDSKDNIELDDELSMLLSKEEIKKEKPVEETMDEFDSLGDMSLDINLDDLDLSNDEMVDTPLNDDEFEKLMNFSDDVGLANSSLDYDDINNIDEKNFDDITNDMDSFDFDSLDELDGLEDLKDFDLDSLDKIDEEITKEEDINLEEIELKEEDLAINEISEELNNYSKGEIMSDEFSELDMLNESDLMAALNEIDNIVQPSTKNVQPTIVSSPKESVSIDSTNVNQLSELISKLLQNKTLEITIKIKD